MSTPLTCIDLFCGCGGFSLGMQRAGFKVLAAIDFNEEAVATFKANFPKETLALRKDLTKFAPDKLAAKHEVDTGPLRAWLDYLGVGVSGPVTLSAFRPLALLSVVAPVVPRLLLLPVTTPRPIVVPLRVSLAMSVVLP